jgi:hypothetical protein
VTHRLIGTYVTAVMPGHVPGIHVLDAETTWMAGTSPAMTGPNDRV